MDSSEKNGPLSITRRGDVMHVTLSRPEVRNAFDARMIAELLSGFEGFARDTTIRAVVLSGEGKAFSAGADLNWMKASLDHTVDQNREEARGLVRMFRAIDECPCPVIAQVQGPALGGGAGLISVCDVVIATPQAKFGFTEVRVGVVPAVISPFVLRKIGVTHARRFFLTGEIFPAETALRIGLVHQIVEAPSLDTAVQSLVDSILKCSPQAVREIKKLTLSQAVMPFDQALEMCADTIARVRVSPEGQEGLRAFLEKRQPQWIGKK